MSSDVPADSQPPQHSCCNLKILSLAKKNQTDERPIPEPDNNGQKCVPEEVVAPQIKVGALCLETERAFIRTVESDYSTLTEQEFYEKYRERFLWDIFPSIELYRQFLKENSNEILGFLLVNALVTDGYILQMDWKNAPEEYLPGFINERLAADYGVEPIDADSLESKVEDVDMYQTEYVKSLQERLKLAGFRLVRFLLDNDQYYTAIIPCKIPLGGTWKEIKLHY